MLDRHECFSVFHHLQKDKQRKQRHSLKLGKKRRESSKRNYYIISPRVIIKAIIINELFRFHNIDSMKCLVHWIPLGIRVRSRNTQPYLKRYPGCMPVHKKNVKSNLHGFGLHRPSGTGNKLLFQVITAIINWLRSATVQDSFMGPEWLSGDDHPLSPGIKLGVCVALFY